MGTSMAPRVSRRRSGHPSRGFWRAGVALALASGCSSGQDETQLLFPDLGAAAGGVEPFLGFPEVAADSPSSPGLLSETLAFADLERLDVAAGILPYSVQTPLWSDGAQKRRWLALPEGEHVAFAEHGAWTFPEGTVFIKHFGMALDEREPDVVRRLETRFLVAARGGGYYGLVYRWSADQRDATLLLDGGSEVLDIVQVDGSTRQQSYTYPRQSDCSRCHSEAAGYVMGVRTAQLNGDHDYATSEGAEAGEPEAGGFNQLAAWAHLGVFDTSISNELDGYDRLVPLGDESASLEARVRSYWDANCSSCHNGGASLASWDARFATPLERQGVISAEPLRPAGPEGSVLVAPGDLEHSILYQRSLSTQPGMLMPPLLRNRVDERYVETLREWILSLR